MGRRVDDVAKINWRGYAGDEAVFPVCMKSPAVNGRRLRAQLIAASERMRNLTLVICDSLDRHNMAGLTNPTEHCVALGDLWLETNLPVVREYFPAANVLRWESDIRSHSSFARYAFHVSDLTKSSDAVKRLRDAMALYYLVSKRKRFEDDRRRGIVYDFDMQAALRSSADYLDEEFAGDMVYYELTGGMPHIYWGLYVDDHTIFARESGLDLGFPPTLAVNSKRLGPSIATSQLSYTKLLKDKDAGLQHAA